jgi:hypothetical protein
VEEQTKGNVSDTKEDAVESLRRKLIDMETPGKVVEFDREEADLVGAFVEDAMSEEDARQGAVDHDV